MSDFSDELKTRADIAAIIGEFVALKQNGERWLGLCPFHPEKTPSFNVHSGRHFYYCFGCQAKGDVYQFLMQKQKLTFMEAVAAVAERLHVPMPRSASPEDDGERAELIRIHADAADFFAQRLRSPEGANARAYLTGRNVTHAAVERFAIGYAPETGRALTQWLQSRNFSPQLALRAGLCQFRRESASGAGAPQANVSWADLYDRFRGRVIFPIGNDRGKIIAFGGRLLASDSVAAQRGPKYLNSPETPIYTKGRVLYNLDRAREAIRGLGYFILVEGYLDCISVFMAGFENVVATCGTALREEQILLISKAARNCVVNFDPDDAGAKAVETSLDLLLSDGLQVRVLRLDDGLDPDEFITKYGAEGYGKALQASPSFFDFLLERARQKHDLRRSQGKVAAMNDLLPHLARISDPIARVQLADELAGRLGVDDLVLRRQVRAAAGERQRAVQQADASRPQLLRSEEVLLRAWLEWEEDRPTLSSLFEEESLLQGLGSEPLFTVLRAATAEGACQMHDLASRLPEEDFRQIAQILLDQSLELSESEVLGAVEYLRQRRLAERLRELQLKLEAARKEQDTTTQREVLVEMWRLKQEQIQRKTKFQIRTSSPARHAPGSDIAATSA